MRVDAFQYELPAELVAQSPAEQRDQARLLLLDPADGPPSHKRVADLPELVPEGALVVLNDTRVVPARLLGSKRVTHGKIEVLLVRRRGTLRIEVSPGVFREAQTWRAIGKSRKPLRFPMEFEVAPREGDGEALVVRLEGRSPADGLLETIVWTESGSRVDDAIRACGHVPLPLYIRRDDTPSDVDRYQTVYARYDGAVAAPTAGLHLTESLLHRLSGRGCEIATVTLHVGLGTFWPVQVGDLDDHPMHAEVFNVPHETVAAIARARARRRPVVAIGTTTARALESAADPTRRGHVRATQDETRLLIQPGYDWRVVDLLFTNFHLPRSTLLALVCSFGGTARVLMAYRVAVRERYRFFSYGDAMLLGRAT